MKVGIVGAGTAGCALALYLSRAGHEVDLFERVAEPGAVGAGILLQPTGQAVLAELGLLDRVMRAGHRVDWLHGLLADGRPLMRLGYGELGRGWFALGLHRGVLFEALFQAVAASKVRVHTGVTVDEIDGGQLATVGAPLSEPFDLVVVADGSRSQLRSMVAPVRRNARYRWGALWFVGQSWPGAPQGELFQVFHRTRYLLGLLPTGCDPAGTQVVSLFWGLRLDTVDELSARGLGAWKDQVRSITAAADPLLDQITSLDQLISAAYHDVVMQRPHNGRAVVIGDAAHAMSPQLGQGANLALCDAAVLGRCLLEGPDIPASLRRYTALRGPQVGFYALASRWLMPLFQHDVGALGLARDLGVPMFNRIPWFRRQSLLSMAGVKDGILSSSAPTALLAPPGGTAG